MAVSQNKQDFRNGEMVHCERCNRLVRVKLYDKGEVVVVSSKEQKELALRCQYCGYVLCDDCAHLNSSMMPVCPKCQREWGPYFITKGQEFDTQTAAPQPVYRPEPAMPAARPSVFSATQVEPDRGIRALRFRILTKGRLIGLLLAAVLLVLGAFFFLGPGAPWLENTVASLIATSTPTLTPTPAFTSTPSASGRSIAARILAMQPTPTTQQTPTPAVTPTATATLPPTETPAPTFTSVPDCTPALNVTMDDVGKTMCVTGVIVEANQRSDAFYVLFGRQSGELYMVSYDGSAVNLQARMCIRVVGEVMKLGTTPVMVLSYQTKAESCP